MNWQDEGILLSVRPHGETSAVVDAFTCRHGRHAGYVRGGQSRQNASILQPGNVTCLSWNARLEEHLGSYRIEPRQTVWAKLRGDGAALAALASVVALVTAYLPDREPHPNLYDETVRLLHLMPESSGWPLEYARWEMKLLRELGYGAARPANPSRGLTPGATSANAMVATALRQSQEYFEAGIVKATGRALPEARARFAGRYKRAS